MTAFLHGIVLQWKLSWRSMEILVHFYLVPLVFYVFIGGIFTSINPLAYETIIPTMTVFGVTMGGILGSPYALVEFYGGDIKKSYQVGRIPLWSMAAGNFISAALHLFVMSMIIFFTAPFLFQAKQPESLPVFFLFLVLTIFSSLSVGMVFGLCLKTSSKLAMATQLVFLPSLMLSGIMFPKTMLPEFLQRAAGVFPATWAFEGMCGKAVSVPGLLVLLGFFVVGLFVSFLRLRRLGRDM